MSDLQRDLETVRRIFRRNENLISISEQDVFYAALSRIEAALVELNELLGEDAGADWFNLKRRAEAAEERLDEAMELLRTIRASWAQPPPYKVPIRIEKLDELEEKVNAV